MASCKALSIRPSESQWPKLVILQLMACPSDRAVAQGWWLLPGRREKQNTHSLMTQNIPSNGAPMSIQLQTQCARRELNWTCIHNNLGYVMSADCFRRLYTRPGQPTIIRVLCVHQRKTISHVVVAVQCLRCISKVERCSFGQMVATVCRTNK